MKQPKNLISVLLDKSARIDERDDAAMDLGSFNEIEAEEALIKVVTDPDEEEMIADSAGESLSEIWERKNKIDTEIIKRLHPAAKKFFKH